MGVYLGPLYQEVEYIESSGTQYIDTGKTVSGDVKIDYTYMPKETVTSSTAGGLLVFIDNDRRNNGFGSSNTYTYYGGNTSNNEGYTVGTLQQDVLCHDIIAKSGCSRTLNGTTVSYVPSSSYPSPTGTLKLFVSQRAGSIINYWKTRMYSFKRYDSGVLTQDLVPCYRKSDNVIGVFDKVENKFYTNAGSGTFIKGNDVRVLQPELKNAYIGEVYEYSYDFRNKTWATCQADGWSVTGGQTPSVGSSGIYYNGWYSNVVKTLDKDFSNANKITFSMYYYAPSNFDGLGFRILKMPGDSNRCGTWISTTDRQVSINNTTVQSVTKSKPSTGWYTQTIEYDLVNKTYSYSGEFSATGSLTDAQITIIRTLNTLGLSLDYSYVGTVSITIEY